ncbi:hypothetical protein ACFUVV_16030 [Streptomyces sp. NPDC057376]|uniref:hypothetical protein n=1 Tax=unclassified Streptomyces TaxID=2593676 RepID=UPI00093C8C73|nr:hypothetical protein [Streptomyces sp. CB02414]OKI90005.1 hypothetical protein AMK11_02205 [Streptomyces sp. CB02414]
MQITEDALKQAWHRLAAGSDLLDDAEFPPTGTSYEQYEDHAEDGYAGLYLVLEEDGSVCGYHGPHDNAFIARDLDETLYFLAEEAVRGLDATIAGQAALMDRIDPAWGRSFRGGGPDGTEPAPPCGRDPLEGFAWIAGSWREQAPYTSLEFFRGENVSAERIALLYGADPEHVAAGTRLSDLSEGNGGSYGNWPTDWQSYCFGQSGDWTFLLYHETAPGTRADAAAFAELGVTETVELSACLGKAIYTFDYVRDGRRLDDDGIIELIYYDRGRTPYVRGGQLDFLNRALRRAELDHPELTDEFTLYFHALETSLGLGLPREEIEGGTVRAARWARRDG